MLSTILFISLIVVFALFLIAFTFILVMSALSKGPSLRKSKKYFNEIYKNKGLKEIKFYRETFRNENYDVPISREEVNELLRRAEEKHSTALVGIEEISFEDRPEEYPYQIFASYTPDNDDRSSIGAVIRVYPLERDPEENMYRFYTDVEKNYYWLITKEEARDELLFSLGHEIGHNIRYNFERRLFGDEIEDYCDEFSKQIGQTTYEQDYVKTRKLYKRDGGTGSLSRSSV
ncbi:hypothetical protein [Metabacillus litoralis]|uniref:hypothetical protein n=1 Tax=Metabacillus litoralis TaxID=152268 RepID=UPI000EF59CD6|nr:hypothetical protein [Metabacillus litoralis]